MKLTKKLVEELIIDYATERTPVISTNVEMFLEICKTDMGYFIYRHLEKRGVKLDVNQVNFFLSNEVNDIAEIIRILEL